MKFKNVPVIKRGNSYCFHIDKTYIHRGYVDPARKYDLVIKEVSS